MSANNYVILNSKGDVALANIINRQSELSNTVNNIPYIQDIQFQNIYDTVYPHTSGRGEFISKIIQTFGDVFPDVDTATANLLLNQILINNSTMVVEGFEPAINTAIITYYQQYKGVCSSMVDLLSQLVASNSVITTATPIDASYAKTLTTQLSITQSNNNLLSHQVNILKSQLAEVKEQETKLRERLLMKDMTIDALQAKLQIDPNVDFKRQIEILQNEALVTSETILNLQKQVSLGNAEQIQTLTDELEKTKHTLETVKKERTELKEELTTLKSEYDNLLSKYEEQGALLISATEQLGQASSDYANLMTQMLGAQELITSLKTQNSDLIKKPEQLKGQLDILTRRYSKLAYDYTELRNGRSIKR